LKVELSGVAMEDDNPDFEKSSDVGKDVLSGDLYLYAVIALAILLVLVILIALRSASYKTAIPPHLKEEIDRIRSGEEPRDFTGGAGVGAAGLPKMKLKKTEGAEDEGKKEEAEDKPRKAAKVKCPECDTIQTVTSSKRPIEIDCKKCGTKLVLKK